MNPFRLSSRSLANVVSMRFCIRSYCRRTLLLIFALKLNRGMPNVKAFFKFLVNKAEDTIIVGWIGLNKMNSQSSLGRTQRPNMQMMGVGNSWDAPEVFAYGSDINARWYSIHRHIERIAQQTPCSIDDDCAD